VLHDKIDMISDPECLRRVDLVALGDGKPNTYF